MAAGHGELVVLGVAQGLMQGPGSQGGAADSQHHHIPAPLQQWFGNLAHLFDDLGLVGQLHETHLAALPSGGQVLMKRLQPGGQAVQVRFFQAVLSQELCHGIIVVEAQLHALDPLGVFVALHGHLAFWGTAGSNPGAEKLPCLKI